MLTQAGALSETVIDVKDEISDLSSNLGLGCLHFTFVTAKLLKSQDGNLFFARVKTGRSGT